MNQRREVSVTGISCAVCGHCKPWVLCVCSNCKKEWWCRVVLAKRWCEGCLVNGMNTVKILLTSGHESAEEQRYWEYSRDWTLSVHKQAERVLVCGFECSKTNLVPALWTVLKQDWEQTKEKCEKRFAWKLRAGQKQFLK